MTQRLLFAGVLCSLLGLGCQASDPTPPPASDPSAASCQPADCGPIAQVARLCDDGSTGAPQCARAEGGACRWQHACPGSAPAVQPIAAGPAEGPSRAPDAQPASPTALADANAAFAQRLYGRLAADPGNLFFSPASLSIALSMTQAGARGETAAQMAKTLELTLAPEVLHPAMGALQSELTATRPGAPELRIANRLWAQAGMPIEPDFQEITGQHYGAGLELVPFTSAPEKARSQINRWVEEKTNNKVKDLMPAGSVDANTRLVLTNAIYFKGKWATPFDKRSTKSEPFTIRPGTSPAVPMMRATLRAGLGQTEDASVLQLAYGSPSPDRFLAMVVILPKEVDGLPTVESRLAAGQLKAYLDVVQPAQVDVALPRFKITWETELSKQLAAMGMPLPFDPTRADFSGISKAVPLYVSGVYHKAFVDVNEEGTEAAAATGVGMRTRSMTAPPAVFRADHPFVFLIRDVATGAVLFMGRVVDPR